MDRTTGLIVQIVAGFAGAHFAATALHEHRFGWLGIDRWRSERLLAPIDRAHGRHRERQHERTKTC